MSRGLHLNEIRTLTARLEAAGYLLPETVFPPAGPGLRAVHCNRHEHSPQDLQDLRSSRKWGRLRVELFVARGRKCQNCGRSTFIEVHHRFYVVGRRVWQYSPEELLVLCDICHRLIHGRTNEAIALLVSEPEREREWQARQPVERETPAWEIERALGYHMDPTLEFDEDNAGDWYEESMGKTRPTPREKDIQTTTGTIKRERTIRRVFL